MGFEGFKGYKRVRVSGKGRLRVYALAVRATGLTGSLADCMSPARVVCRRIKSMAETLVVYPGFRV